ncbi:hypothetical protein GCM10023231_00400 [Olivibacter ginsenosidimutans]|uniref:Response regulatory domain-containing protein n=1 Tax=Olivibacter ginsenosidimutans TaxID=1176537 RepID=A0ABP9AD05_9SPHI
MNKTILYVDDDDTVLAVMKDILHCEGFNIIVDDGNSLFKILHKEQIGLIFMDERLKKGYGSDLCKHIKASKSFNNIPVIMVSGQWAIPEIAHECGASGFIRKPFDMYDVISLINLHYTHRQK